MAFSPRDFADDTDFERFTLDRLGPHRVRIAEAAFVYHVETRPDGRRHRHMAVSVTPAISSAQDLDKIRRSLRPVGFGAAYKVLDMLVEHVLRANGFGSGRMRFMDKSSALSARNVALPVPLDGRPDLWDRLKSLYVAFQDARHAVTHRRAQVTPSGDLDIYDTNTALSDTITSTELAAFTAAVLAVAEAVIDVDADKRQANIVAWHLNSLAPRHRLPALFATDPEAGRRLLVSDLVPLDNGLVRFDVAEARSIVTHQEPPSLWDIELRAEGRVFVGRWEEVPDERGDQIDFHPAAPPNWLSEQAT